MNKEDDTLDFRDISDKEATQEISSFIVKKKEEGITKLSVLDFVLNLKIPAEQVEKILSKYEKDGKIKEIKLWTFFGKSLSE